MLVKELLPRLKEILDTYHNVNVKWDGGCIGFGKSICYNEYSIAPNNCSCHFIKYYKRYKNFEKQLLQWDITLNQEITFLSYGSTGLKNYVVVIGT